MMKTTGRPSAVHPEQALAPEFLRAHRAGSGGTATAVLEELLQAAVAEGRTRWPKIRFPAPQYAAFLGERCRGAAPEAKLRGLHLLDLYLVGACLLEDKEAQRALDGVLAQARPVVQRLNPSSAFVEEAEQLLRQKLLAPESGRAKLSDYAGQGSLLSWLKAALLRTGLNLQRKYPKEVPAERELLDQVAPSGGDPELTFLKSRYAPEFKESFAEALKSLSPKTQNVLRLHLCNGLTLEQVGRLYQVNRSTVSRWIDAASQQLLDVTRETLAQRLRLSRSELNSVMRLFASNLNVSLASFLRNGS